MKIIEKKFVPITEAKNYLKESKRELYEQKLAYEYARTFSKLKPAEAEKLIKELESLNISKLKRKFIIMIVDILPSSMDELRTILSSSDVTFKSDEVKKIFEVISKFKR